MVFLFSVAKLKIRSVRLQNWTRVLERVDLAVEMGYLPSRAQNGHGESYLAALFISSEQSAPKKTQARGG